MRINEVTYEKLKTPLKVNGNLNVVILHLCFALLCSFTRMFFLLQMQKSKFEGLLTTVLGYLIIAMALVLCHVSLLPA